MPWCPKCKSEYREKFTMCSDCGCELVKELEGDENQETQGDRERVENDTEVLLITVRNDIEAKIIESKLSSFGVPSVKQFRGIDGVYGITSYSGIDLYVPSSLLDNAKDIIKNEN